MKATELMTKNPKTCGPDHDLACAVRIMKEEDCGIVPVIKGNGQERVVGVVTDRDIALHLGETNKKASDVKVQDVMTTDVVSCAPDADAHAFSRRMQDAQVRRILVVDDGKLVGVVSTADLARHIGSGTGIGEEVKQVVINASQPRV